MRGNQVPCHLTTLFHIQVTAGPLPDELFSLLQPLHYPSVKKMTDPNVKNSFQHSPKDRRATAPKPNSQSSA